MLLRCIFCVLSSAIMASVVLSLTYGQTQPLPQPEKKTKVLYKEKSYYDFEDTLINGNVRKPDGSFIFRKSQSTFSSALNMKRSFIPELKESAPAMR
jgi:hypothetical protein